MQSDHLVHYYFLLLLLKQHIQTTDPSINNFFLNIKTIKRKSKVPKYKNIRREHRIQKTAKRIHVTQRRLKVVVSSNLGTSP